MVDDRLKPDALKASLQSVEQSDTEVAVVIRLSNTATRALHYISNVRATRYDPATKTLRLCLSDEGRKVILGVVNKLPVFRHINPGAQAELHLKVPNRVVKLTPSTPPGRVAFERHDLSNVEEVVVEVAWADIPYYEDTRPSKDLRLPAARWQQHTARTGESGGSGGRGRSGSKG